MTKASLAALVSSGYKDWRIRFTAGLVSVISDVGVMAFLDIWEVIVGHLAAKTMECVVGGCRRRSRPTAG